MSRQVLAWPPVSVTQRLQEHRQLVKEAKTFQGSDTLESALARYLVIRAAGLVEAVRDDVADMHSRQVSAPRAHRRITSGLRKGTGAKPGQLIDFVKTFDPVWSDELSDFLSESDEVRKNNLSVLVAARIKVAHGDGENVTMAKALKWATTAEEVALWLSKRFDPTT